MGSIVALGQRLKGQGDTDLTVFRFGANGVPHGDHGIVGFLVQDGPKRDNSNEAALAGSIHCDGRMWAAGQSGTGLSTDSAAWIDSQPEHRIGGAAPLD